MSYGKYEHTQEWIPLPFSALKMQSNDHIDTATMGMETHPSSPRTEIDLMTEQELASHLKICRRQLYNWRVAGLIPYFKMGKAVRFRVADINEALERMEMGSVCKN
jgi:excisionase family DNA binding protein